MKTLQKPSKPILLQNASINNVKPDKFHFLNCLFDVSRLLKLLDVGYPQIPPSDRVIVCARNEVEYSVSKSRSESDTAAGKQITFCRDLPQCNCCLCGEYRGTVQSNTQYDSNQSSNTQGDYTNTPETSAQYDSSKQNSKTPDEYRDTYQANTQYESNQSSKTQDDYRDTRQTNTQNDSKQNSDDYSNNSHPSMQYDSKQNAKTQGDYRNNNRSSTQYDSKQSSKTQGDYKDSRQSNSQYDSAQNSKTLSDYRRASQQSGQHDSRRTSLNGRSNSPPSRSPTRTENSRTPCPQKANPWCRCEERLASQNESRASNTRQTKVYDKECQIKCTAAISKLQAEIERLEHIIQYGEPAKTTQTAQNRTVQVSREHSVEDMQEDQEEPQSKRSQKYDSNAAEDDGSCDERCTCGYGEEEVYKDQSAGSLKYTDSVETTENKPRCFLFRKRKPSPKKTGQSAVVVPKTQKSTAKTSTEVTRGTTQHTNKSTVDYSNEDAEMTNRSSYRTANSRQSPAEPRKGHSTVREESYYEEPSTHQSSMERSNRSPSYRQESYHEQSENVPSRLNESGSPGVRQQSYYQDSDQVPSKLGSSRPATTRQDGETQQSKREESYSYMTPVQDRSTRTQPRMQPQRLFTQDEETYYDAESDTVQSKLERTTYTSQEYQDDYQPHKTEKEYTESKGDGLQVTSIKKQESYTCPCGRKVSRGISNNNTIIIPSLCQPSSCCGAELKIHAKHQIELMENIVDEIATQRNDVKELKTMLKGCLNLINNDSPREYVAYYYEEDDRVDKSGRGRRCRAKQEITYPEKSYSEFSPDHASTPKQCMRCCQGTQHCCQSRRSGNSSRDYSRNRNDDPEFNPKYTSTPNGNKREQSMRTDPPSRSQRTGKDSSRTPYGRDSRSGTTIMKTQSSE